MSFSISYEKLRDPEFTAGIGKIYRFPKFKDVKLMMRIVRLTKLLQKYMDEGQEVYVNLVKQYALLDDKGNFIPPENKALGDFQIPPANQEEWAKKKKEFAETTVEIFAEKFEVFNFSEVGLTPAELDALEPILILED